MHSRKISVIGIGYVGLQVAVAFGKKSNTVAFDINQKRLQELSDGYDRTKDVDVADLLDSNLLFTSDINDLVNADFHIVTVPTPVNLNNEPDLTLIKMASESIGKILKPGDIVVYESTVYPGVTEEICVPILESKSGMKSIQEFSVGYSPERINPSDDEHTFSNTTKVVSGQNRETLEIIASVYESVIDAEVYKANSIKIAEAAKVIENTQRDINIALMNELSMIFKKMDIDTNSVLEAAMTKWNFVGYKPGLVGGHCIGIDPYYLTHKAKELGYKPEVILSGRKINDQMATFVAEELIHKLKDKSINTDESLITILGVTYKHNCNDIRNSKVFDLIRYLEKSGATLQIYDPLADHEEVQNEYQVNLTSFSELKPADVLVLAVAHEKFLEFSVDDYLQLMKKNSFVVDIPGMISIEKFSGEMVDIWRL